MPTLPHQISLPILHDMKQLRGALSTHDKDIIIVGLRLNVSDRDLIRDAAATCNTTQSLFMRWYATAAAARIQHLTMGNKSLWLTPPLPETLPKRSR